VPAQPTTLGGDVDDDVLRPISDVQALLFLSNRLTRGGVHAKSANSPQFSSDGDRIPRVTVSELWDGVSGRPAVSRSLDVISPSIRRYRILLGEDGGPIVSATARQEDAQRGVVESATATANCGILSNCLFRQLSHEPRDSYIAMSGGLRAAAAASNSCWKGVMRGPVPIPSELTRTWQMPSLKRGNLLALTGKGFSARHF